MDKQAKLRNRDYGYGENPYMHNKPCGEHRRVALDAEMQEKRQDCGRASGQQL